MAEAGAAQQEAARFGAEMDVHQHKGQQYRCAEGGDADDEACQELAEGEELAAHGGEQIVVQAAFHHLASEQAGEQAQAAEEDAQAQVVELEDAGEDGGVLVQRVAVATFIEEGGQGVQADGEQRQQGQQIQPQPPPAAQVLAQLEAQDGAQLAAAHGREASDRHGDPPPSLPSKY
jgi:hypothetical protein